MPSITDALRAKRALVKQRMAAAARTGVVTAAVQDELRNQLTAASEPGLASSIPRAVAFETTSNFSNKSIAGEGVEAGFGAAALAGQIQNMYWNAIVGEQDQVVAVKGLGDVKINVQNSIARTSAAGGAQQAAATHSMPCTVSCTPLARPVVPDV